MRDLLAEARCVGLTPGEERALNETLGEMGAPETWQRCAEWPPCGGCDSCTVAQITYTFTERAALRRRRAEMGLLVAKTQIQLVPVEDAWTVWVESCRTWERMLRP